MGTTQAVLRIAAFHGHLDILTGGFFREDVSIKTIEQMSPPIICQHPEIVRWVRIKSQSAPILVLLDHTIAKGDLGFVSSVYDSESDRNVSAASHKGLREAAEAGQLEMLKWIRSYDSRIKSELAMQRAASAGHLDVVKWLDANDTYRTLKQPNADAVLNGHVEVVKWMVQEYKFLNENMRFRWFTLAMSAALTSGDWPMIRHIYEHRPEALVKRGLGKAIAHGDLELVKWLVSEGFTGIREPILDAAAAGHLHILQWLNECFPGQGTMDLLMQLASRNNYLHTIKWLHENRTGVCNKGAMGSAAFNGSLEIVQWLHVNRPEYDETSEQYSAEYNLSPWLVSEPMYPIGLAAEGGHLDVIQFLNQYREEKDSTDAMDKAAANGHLHVFRWLHEHRQSGCTEKAVNQAAANGHRDVLDFLVSIRPYLKCDESTATAAADRDLFQVIEWLEKHQPTIAALVIPTMNARMVSLLHAFDDLDAVCERPTDCYESDSIEEDYGSGSQSPGEGEQSDTEAN